MADIPNAHQHVCAACGHEWEDPGSTRPVRRQALKMAKKQMKPYTNFASDREETTAIIQAARRFEGYLLGWES